MNLINNEDWVSRIIDLQIDITREEDIDSRKREDDRIYLNEIFIIIMVLLVIIFFKYEIFIIFICYLLE